jgi:hypothetical protein
MRRTAPTMPLALVPSTRTTERCCLQPTRQNLRPGQEREQVVFGSEQHIEQPAPHLDAGVFTGIGSHGGFLWGGRGWTRWNT